MDRFGTILTRGLQKLKAAEKDITKYDQEVGDGDCGIGLRKGADGMFSAPNTAQLQRIVYLKNP